MSENNETISHKLQQLSLFLHQQRKGHFDSLKERKVQLTQQKIKEDITLQKNMTNGLPKHPATFKMATHTNDYFSKQKLLISQSENTLKNKSKLSTTQNQSIREVDYYIGKNPTIKSSNQSNSVEDEATVTKTIPLKRVAWLPTSTISRLLKEEKPLGGEQSPPKVCKKEFYQWKPGSAVSRPLTSVQPLRQMPKEQEHPYAALRNSLFDECKFKKLEPFKPGRAVSSAFGIPKPIKVEYL